MRRHSGSIRFRAATERARHLCNGRALPTEASRLFEGVRHLQYAEVYLGAADNLQPNRQPFGSETSGNGSRRIPDRRNIPAGFHPISEVVEFHAYDLSRIGCVHVERRAEQSIRIFRGTPESAARSGCA